MCHFNWDTFWNFLQGMGAIASVVIAWHVYKQGNKIKTLTDVVERMDHQNTLLQERLKIEKYATMAEIIPVYTWQSKVQGRPDKATITLLNVGVEAKDIFTTQSNDDTYIVFLHDHHAEKDKSITLDVSTKDGKPLENIDFFIVSTAISGLTSKQKIFKYPEHDLNIGFPEF